MFEKQHIIFVTFPTRNIDSLMDRHNSARLARGSPHTSALVQRLVQCTHDVHSDVRSDVPSHVHE